MPFFSSERNLIAISGKQYTGKDVVADLLMELLPEFRKVPIALAIKTAYAQRHGLTLEEIEGDKATHRPGLIALGDWGRAQDPDYWLRQVLADPTERKIVSDLRLKREYDFFKAHGAFLLRMEAARAVRSARGRLVSEDDPTECELDDVRDWDVVIVNNGSLEELKAQVVSLVRSS